MNLTIKIFIASIIICLFLYSKGYGQVSYPLNWEIDYTLFLKRIPSGIKYEKFIPEKRPQYENIIMKFIIALRNSLKNITIIRLRSYPETDYVFVKDKLLVILENWKIINSDNNRRILKRLKKRFGKSDIKKDGKLYIHSFGNSKTKVLLYKEQLAPSRYKSKIYYYPRKLFRILLKE